MSKRATHRQIVTATKSAMKLPDSQYILADISGEAWREVQLSGGMTIRIVNPVMLIIRKGGHTHRVVDAQCVVHCYAAPETGHSVIRWQNKGNVPCRF